MSDQKRIKYERYYSLYLKEIDRFLSFSSVVMKWAYLYKKPKPLWFTKVDGKSEGHVKTGDLVYLKALIVGKTYLHARGADKWTADWAHFGGDSLKWRLWKDTDRMPGLDISLDDHVVITNEAYGQYSYLSQEKKYPDYVTVSASEDRFKWRIRDSDGKEPEPQDDAQLPPPPPDTATEVPADGAAPDDPYSSPTVDD